MSTIARPASNVERINPNTGGRMNIDASTYSLFSNVINHTSQGDVQLTSTQIVETPQAAQPKRCLCMKELFSGVGIQIPPINFATN